MRSSLMSYSSGDPFQGYTGSNPGYSIISVNSIIFMTDFILISNLPNLAYIDQNWKEGCQIRTKIAQA